MAIANYYSESNAMSLEDRIIKRWQDWWTNKCFELNEGLMKELVVIALEEVQRGMVEPRFTIKEAIANILT